MPHSFAFDDQTLIQASSRIVSCELDDEAVLLDPQAGVYFGLNAVGSAIWSMLASPSSVDHVCHAVTARFDVDEDECRDDVRMLIEELLTRDLAVVVPGRPA